MIARVISLAVARAARIPTAAEQARIRAREHAESLVHAIDRYAPIDEIEVEIGRVVAELRRAEGLPV